MDDLYNLIKQECEKQNVSVSRMCLDLGMSKSVMSDLKSGKKKALSATTLSKVAEYLNVSVDYLLGNEKSPSPKSEELINGDPELTEYLEELSTRSEMRMLFHVAKSATKEQIEAIVKLVESMGENG